jgi:hypothetical protein
MGFTSAEFISDDYFPSLWLFYVKHFTYAAGKSQQMLSARYRSRTVGKQKHSDARPIAGH